VLYLAFAKVVEVRTPMRILLEVIGQCLERRMCPASPQSITRCAMLNTSAGHARLLVHIDYATDRPAVHTHSQLQIGVSFSAPADFQRTFHRLFRALVKNQRHTVARGNLINLPAASAFEIPPCCGRSDERYRVTPRCR